MKDITRVELSTETKPVPIVKYSNYAGFNPLCYHSRAKLEEYTVGDSGRFRRIGRVFRNEKGEITFSIGVPIHKKKALGSLPTAKELYVLQMLLRKQQEKKTLRVEYRSLYEIKKELGLPVTRSYYSRFLEEALETWHYVSVEFKNKQDSGWSVRHVLRGYDILKDGRVVVDFDPDFVDFMQDTPYTMIDPRLTKNIRGELAVNLYHYLRAHENVQAGKGNANCWADWLTRNLTRLYVKLGGNPKARNNDVQTALETAIRELNDNPSIKARFLMRITGRNKTGLQGQVRVKLL